MIPPSGALVGCEAAKAKRYVERLLIVTPKMLNDTPSVKDYYLTS